MIKVIVFGVIYNATLLGCYDGDTCKVKVDKFIPFQEHSLRLEGFDTPEIRGKCDEEKALAYEAKEETLKFMQKDNVVIHVSGKDKYGRLISKVEGLGDMLIEKKLARPYDGGKRQSWCNK